MLQKDRFVKDYSLVKFGSKGWLNSKGLPCPICNRSDKFGIKFYKESIVTNCFYCDEVPNGNKFLRLIGREDLITNERAVYLNDKLSSLGEEDEEITLKIEEKQLPHKFKYIFYDDYLEQRGFEEYELFHTGKSEVFTLKGYIIFLLHQQDKLVGWLARSRKPKEWHDENLRQYKEKGTGLRLRYKNSPNTDFTRILGMYDEITENTHTVWLVEGIMDCANLYKLYKLKQQEGVKCCFTFGNKVSDEQIRLLRGKKSVKDIVILYDYGTTDRIKKYGVKLMKHFNVQVGEFKDKNIDAGDADKKYLDEIFSNLTSIFYFYKNRLV